LSTITVTPVSSPGSPPADVNALGLYYDFGPSGTTFSSLINITLKYDPAALPAGADQSMLYIAWWDISAGQWVSLPCIVDPVNHTVTATVSHFTIYSVLAPVTATGGISALAIVGIVAGSLIIIGLIVWMMMRRRRTA
jgi:hypothetical protein